MLRYLILALSAGLALATVSVSERTEEPCAVVASAFSQQGLPPYTVDAELALACLRSVPLDTQNNTLLLKAFKSFTQFESNLAYIKKPPPG